MASLRDNPHICRITQSVIPGCQEAVGSIKNRIKYLHPVTAVIPVFTGTRTAMVSPAIFMTQKCCIISSERTHDLGSVGRMEAHLRWD